MTLIISVYFTYLNHYKHYFDFISFLGALYDQNKSQSLGSTMCYCFTPTLVLYKVSDVYFTALVSLSKG
ncbi:hypothetical protein HNR74_003517 [Flammeovirga kamogawensis]|nr:hypothetical protein [Flammeovirga kamogawensis]